MIVLDTVDERLHPSIHIDSICTVMCSTVTVRAQCNHIARIIWTTVGQAPNVVRFKKWRSIRTLEWRVRATIFAAAPCSSEYVLANDLTALKRRHRSNAAGRTRSGGRECSRPERRQILRSFCNRRVIGLSDSIERPQLENDGLSDISVCIGGISMMMRFIHIRAHESYTFTGLAEKEQVTPIFRMVSNGEVSANHLHIANPTLAEIFECSIGAKRIIIPMRSALLACNDEYGAVWPCGCDNTTLLLPAELGMYILPAVIGAPFNKSPRHSCSLLCNIDREVRGVPKDFQLGDENRRHEPRTKLPVNNVSEVTSYE